MSLNGGLVRSHRDVAHHGSREVHRLQPRPLLLERVLDVHPVDPVDDAHELPAEVVLAREEGGHARGIVLVDHELHAVDVGQAGHEVAGMPDHGHAEVRPVAVEHPGAGADGRLGLLQIAELLHALAGDDGHGVRIGDHVEEPHEGLLQSEPHGVFVDRLDLVERREHVGIGIALDGPEALDAVHDVVGGQLASVHRRLRMPPDARPQLEDVRRLVGLGPRLGDVALDGEDPGRHRRPRLVLEEPAMGERVGDVGLVGDREMRVEVRRVPGANSDDAAPFRSLGQGAPRGQMGAEGGPRGQGRCPFDDIAAADGARVECASCHGRLLPRRRRLF